MHHAPPVVFPVGRFVWGLRVLLMLALVGVWGLGMWQVVASYSGFIWAWVSWGVLLCVAMFVSSSDILSGGSLVWTGENWVWRDAEGRQVQVQVQVLLDVGSALLLVTHPVEGGQRLSQRFAWLEGRDMPQMWHGLRCAVYSRPKLKQNSGDHVGDAW